MTHLSSHIKVTLWFLFPGLWTPPRRRRFDAFEAPDTLVFKAEVEVYNPNLVGGLDHSHWDVWGVPKWLALQRKLFFGQKGVGFFPRLKTRGAVYSAGLLQREALERQTQPRKENLSPDLTQMNTETYRNMSTQVKQHQTTNITTLQTEPTYILSCLQSKPRSYINQGGDCEEGQVHFAYHGQDIGQGSLDPVQVPAQAATKIHANLAVDISNEFATWTGSQSHALLTNCVCICRHMSLFVLESFIFCVSVLFSLAE